MTSERLANDRYLRVDEATELPDQIKGFSRFVMIEGFVGPGGGPASETEGDAG